MIPKRGTKLGLRSLLLGLSLLIWGAEGSFLRQLNGQNPHKKCNAEDLTEYCPDDSVVQSKLIAQCQDKTGIPAARCYMEYLCENHRQEAVDSHKECIDQECPLAKHIPPLNCADYLGVEETDEQEEEEEEANNDNNNNSEGGKEETENTDVADEDILGDLYGKEEEEPTSTNEAKEDEVPLGFEFIDDEEVEVQKPQQSQESSKEEENAETQQEEPKELHVPEEDNNNDNDNAEETHYYHPTTRTFICVAVPLILTLIALIFRDRICGTRENFPEGAEHITMENEIQFNANANAQVT